VILEAMEPKTSMQKCKSFIIRSKSSWRGEEVNINVELINIGRNFNLKLEIKFYDILGRRGSQEEHITS
jgi:hypothetical protein